MRDHHYSILHEIAHEARALTFDHEIAGAEAAGTDMLDNRDNRRNVYPCYKRWMIKQYLGGTQLTVAYADDVYRAAKIADALTFHFSIYRKPRIGGEHPDARYHFGKKEAGLSIEMYPKLKTWLISLQAHLQTFLTLKTWATQEQEAAARHEQAKETRQRKRTVRGEFLEYIGALEDRIVDLEKTIADNHREIKSILMLREPTLVSDPVGAFTASEASLRAAEDAAIEKVDPEYHNRVEATKP